MEEEKKLIYLQPDEGIFGLPPLENLYVSKHVVKESFPIATIWPAEPDFSSSMTLFSVNSGDEVWAKYDKILANLGFQIDHPIKLAFLADNFPSDTFTSSYGESFLQKITDVGSQTASQLTQMTGSKTVTEAMKKLGTATKNAGGEMGGVIGTMMEMAGSFGAGAGSALQNLQNTLSNSENSNFKFLGGAADTINKLGAGQRVDFPQFWLNSGFSPSYTMTIRLYNSNPGNLRATQENIIGPLAVILVLATPRTEAGHTYSFPFMQQLKCEGIFDLLPAVITNISVIKGGDSQQIAWNQRLGIVDVRLSFSSLFSSMLAEEGDLKLHNRPTLSNYLKVLEGKKDISMHYSQAGDEGGSVSTLIKKDLQKTKSVTTTTVRSDDIPERTNSTDLAEAVELEDEAPPF